MTRILLRYGCDVLGRGPYWQVNYWVSKTVGTSPLELTQRPQIQLGNLQKCTLLLRTSALGYGG